MKKSRDIHVLMLMVVLSLIAFSGLSAEGGSLTTQEAAIVDVPGTFSLILYGGRHFRDAESLALLDVEGDLYTLEPYAPEFDYRIIKGLPAKDALERAQSFLSSHYAFRRSLLSKILDSGGKTIGYELRPLYDPLSFGVTDVLDVDYVPRKDGKVRVYIHLKASVWQQLFGGDGSRDNGH